LKGIGVASPTSSGVYSKAASINSQGSVVGSLMDYTIVGAHEVAGAWKADGTPINLNKLLNPNSGWTRLTYAGGISDAGWIAGAGAFDPDGVGGQAAYSRTFLMLVPELGTYGKGDANFDSIINFSDLVILAQHYNESNGSQNVNVADFDLNGTTDFQDLVILSQNYNAADTGTSDFAADWALAQSLVPEPSLGLLAIAGAGFARRRRS
jgi:MYXO-CTERM domain-containing protein